MTKSEYIVPEQLRDTNLTESLCIGPYEILHRIVPSTKRVNYNHLCQFDLKSNRPGTLIINPIPPSCTLENLKNIVEQVQVNGSFIWISVEFSISGVADFNGMTRDQIYTSIRKVQEQVSVIMEHVKPNGIEIDATCDVISQSLHSMKNSRTDEFGGSIQNRSCLLMTIIKELLKVVPSQVLSVKVNPFQDLETDPICLAEYAYIFGELESWRRTNGITISFIHLEEPLHNFDVSNNFVHAVWKGVVVREGNFRDIHTIKDLMKNDKTLIALE
ncbi:hypothetical protein KAFR_0B04485 [Kazachstania africana CBS 2517]|uniref:NADH:flavin oxidoreductase/NADH oxidase N-terminal domain-containing protein n=1 Tax=Kazachstania africana (strain ATCC 22294 / BCRC 22015 / CBS 2517 / CECT 1963 / NBRC 1671 / NRRL Y-8276) TaxID=1071382 RepID=H2AQU5_KAZAF|nr:hypothetical protein KAFR_0B04485 [Kazachstania africana CBS 2517]CCF56745.1 hypothetical protein KAFR_0B04485 [Kazachstania africana CBS 2517]